MNRVDGKKIEKTYPIASLFTSALFGAVPLPKLSVTFRDARAPELVDKNAWESSRTALASFPPSNIAYPATVGSEIESSTTLEAEVPTASATTSAP